MFGDWIYWSDQANALIRLVSPQGFVAGRLANLSPEQSSLNKPLYGVIGTQKSGQPGLGTATTYATADLSVLLGAGIDVIANPQPGGAFWGVRGGHNSSSRCRNKWRQLYKVNKLHCEYASKRDGRVCWTIGKFDLVSKHSRDVAVFSERFAIAGAFGQHFQCASIRRGLRY